jgi:hypothetical protein
MSKQSRAEIESTSQTKSNTFQDDLDDDWHLCSITDQDCPERTNLDQSNNHNIDINECYTNSIINCTNFHLCSAVECAFTDCIFENLIHLSLVKPINRCFINCKFPQLQTVTTPSAAEDYGNMEIHPVFVSCIFPFNMKDRLDYPIFSNCSVYPQITLFHPILLKELYESNNSSLTTKSEEYIDINQPDELTQNQEATENKKVQEEEEKIRKEEEEKIRKEEVKEEEEKIIEEEVKEEATENKKVQEEEEKIRKEEVKEEEEKIIEEEVREEEKIAEINEKEDISILGEDGFDSSNNELFERIPFPVYAFLTVGAISIFATLIRMN